MTAREIRGAGLTPRQALAVMRVTRLIRVELCVRCHKYRRQGKNHYCRFCNRNIRLARRSA